MPHLRRIGLTVFCFFVLCLASANVAQADTIAFTFTIDGTVTNLPMATFHADGSGTVAPFGTATFVADGSLGAVNLDGSRPVSGAFTFNFEGGNSFAGTFTGTNFARDPVTQVAQFTRSLTITGGTGIFSLAAGSATAAGSSLLNPSGVITFSFSSADGTISAPGLSAIPEPATLLLFSTGVAGLGAVVHRRRKAHQCEAG